tara:strand:+ start:7962 stop:9023 length:1062 start_codon:yes stop_codon:yes gene_type:complete
MTITLRGQKGSELTHQELDGNFTDLDNKISALPDSNQVIGLIDSSYVQARQSFAAGADSADVAIVAQPMIDSSILATVNSTYVQARQDFQYSSLTGRPTNLSSFNNDEGYTTYDSTNTIGLVDSAYINSRTSSYDSDNTLGLVDSAYINSRISTIDSASVVALIDSSYVTGLAFGGGGSIQFFTATGSAVKKGDGNVIVHLAGGGGGASAQHGGNGGNSYGAALFTNITDGTTITITQIGAGGASASNGSAGGTTTVTAGSQTISMGGGGGAVSNSYGSAAYQPSVSGGAIAFRGPTGTVTGTFVTTTLFGHKNQPGTYSTSSRSGYGVGGVGGSYQGSKTPGTDGCVLLIGV